MHIALCLDNMGLKLVWLVLFLFLLEGWQPSYGCLEKERNAILQLKTFFNKPLPPDYWREGEKGSSCCEWERAECNATTGRVTKLSLQNAREGNYLVTFDPNASVVNLLPQGNWYLNASMFLPFEELKSLDLSDNSVAGCIHNEGFEKLASLSNLEALYLSDNRFNISVLSTLSGLSSLKTLDIAHNQLKGSIDVKDMVYFKKLEYLRLDGCALNNNFLQTVGVISSLKVLRMSGCGLSGAMPPSQGICELKRLQRLDISNNNLGGALPQCLANLTSLQYLYLSSNQINGSIPATQGLCELVHLQQLDVSDNDIEGVLPWCLANLTSLQYLDLSSNHFTGNLSPLQGQTSLQYLSLSNNHFQISLSLAPFYNHSKLQYIYGRDNEISAETEFHSLIPKFQLDTIYLSGNGHGSGAMPAFLYHQHELRMVELSDIKMEGPFPNWLIGNNTKLQTLSLVNDSISGPFQLPIHPHMGLQYLNISNNHFSGHIPTEIGEYLPMLNLLDMSANGFNGSIPSSFGDMKSLYHLDLSNNHFCGHIPTEIGEYLPNLSWLSMSGNGFNGRIPASFGNMKLLDTLDLSNNRFSGELPELLALTCASLKQLELSNNSMQGQLSSNCSCNLIKLDVSNNSLSGRIPESLSLCPRLSIFDARHNILSSGIPKWMGNMSYLRVLDLSYNSISGSLPRNLGSSGIFHLHLAKNRLQGSLENVFYNSSSLVTLDLSSNHLVGKIPNWIGKLSNLSLLLLRNNNFEGEIPIQLCHLDKLSIIDLSHNILSGPIPTCLRIQSKIQEVLGFYNIVPIPIQNFTGFATNTTHESVVEITTKSHSYTYKGIVLQYMCGLDLSSNKLTGRIPPEVGSLGNIRVLNLSHNSLIGPIPPTFSKLKDIESMDLSYNHLEGEIPTQLIELYSLAIFSVAYNNLSGKTPETVAQFATFEESSYIGNPLLCGLPLPRNCSTAEPPLLMPTSPTNDEEDSGFIDMKAFYASFAGSYVVLLLGIVAVLYINPYWRRVWFYYVELWATTFYYFVVDNLPNPSRFRIM